MTKQQPEEEEKKKKRSQPQQPPQRGKKQRLPPPPPPPPVAPSDDDEEEECGFTIDRNGGAELVSAAEEEEEKEEERGGSRSRMLRAAVQSAASAASAAMEEEMLQQQLDPPLIPEALAHLGEHPGMDAGYALTRAYFAGREKLRLARHHIDSANHFYHYQVPDTIRMFNAHRVDPVTGVEEPPVPHRMVSSQKDKNYDTNDYNLSICYDIGNLRYIQPQMIEPSGETRPMWPQDARERARTYAARSKVDIKVTVRHRYNMVAAGAADVNAFHTEQYTIPNVDFVQIPVMVNSALCLQGVQRAARIQEVYASALAEARLKRMDEAEAVLHAQRAANAAPLCGAEEQEQDCGGYFIIRGSPKVVIAQEHCTENRIHVFPHKKNVWRGWVAQLASVPDDRCVSPKCLDMGLLPRSNLYGHPLHVALPASRMKKKATMSLFLLFRALGVMRDRDICEIILGGPVETADPGLLADLRASMYDADQILERPEFRLDSSSSVVPPQEEEDEAEQQQQQQQEEDKDEDNNEKDWEDEQFAAMSKEERRDWGLMAADVCMANPGMVSWSTCDVASLARPANLSEEEFRAIVRDLAEHEVRVAKKAAAREAREARRAERVERAAARAAQDAVADRARRMDDALLRERAVVYIQSTLSIYDLRNRISALPTRGGGGGGIQGGPKLAKVTEYSPQQAIAHACYARGDVAADTTAIATPKLSTARVGGQHAMDTPLLAGPPTELVEYLETGYVRATTGEQVPCSSVMRQAVFRHCEARRNVLNELHRYRRQYSDAARGGEEGSSSSSNSATTDSSNNNTPAAAAAASWSGFMLGILAVRREHQRRGRTADWHRSQTLRVLENDLLPHCKNQQKTVFLLGLMANRLLRVVRGELPPSDRDAYLAKRVEPTGVQLNNLFRNLYLRFQKEFDKQIKGAIEASGSWKLPSQIFTAENAHQLFNPALIETGLISALSSGDFSVKQSRDGNQKAGVAQVLSRLNYLSVLSHVRRINTPIAGKSGELVAPRKLHGTTYGFLCPVETPEGRPVGLIKQLSLLTLITLPQLHSSVLYEQAEQLASDLVIGQPETYAGTRLLINGAWVGVARAPDECVAALRDCKLRGKFSPYTSIVFDHVLGEIRVCTDAGRLCRPLLRVNPATGRVYLEQRHLDALRTGELQWDDLMLRRDGVMDEPIIEYLDVEEQSFALIVGYESNIGSSSSSSIGKKRAAAAEAEEEPTTKKKRTTSKKRGAAAAAEAEAPKKRPRTTTSSTLTTLYCEIHPMTILGVIAGTIPFMHHNQSPRNTYQAAMGKQAIGFLPRHNWTMDKTVLHQNFPTVPLVATEVSRILNCSASGCMIHLAIASYTGYNQEDSLIMNRASIERGLFLCTVFKTERDSNRGSEETAVERCNPLADPTEAAATSGIKLNGIYSGLEPNGFNRENAHLVNRQILTGKRIRQALRRNGGASAATTAASAITGLPAALAAGGFQFEDKSRMVRLTEDAYVHRNSLARDGDGFVTASVTYRITRKMGLGDKSASRSAQKAVLGRDMAPEDMPFSAEGTTLDALLNPHAITSRMTVGQLAESNFGRVLAELGLFGDCSAFCEVTPESIAAELRRCGFASTGTEVFYDGHTGRPFRAEVFAGYTYYQRLKHMVNDKHHSRTTGPMVPTTRQPSDGRARDGGLRLGEMERDCVISHGCADFLHERMFTASDAFTLPVCRVCGATAVVNPGDKPVAMAVPGQRVYRCNVCDNRTDFTFVDCPYAMKLYTQELGATGISTRIL